MSKGEPKNAAEEKKASKGKRKLVEQSDPEHRRVCAQLSAVLLTAPLREEHRKHIRQAMEYIARQAGEPMAEDRSNV